MKTSVTVRHYVDPTDLAERYTRQRSPSPAHVHHSHYASLPPESSMSSEPSWPSSDSDVEEVIRKVKHTVKVYEEVDDDDSREHFRQLRTRSGLHMPSGWQADANTTITKQRKKSWVTVTELENGDIEEITTTKIITETYEPIDPTDVYKVTDRFETPRSRSRDHKSVAPPPASVPQRSIYSKAFFTPERPQDDERHSRLPSRTSSTASQFVAPSNPPPPPPESIVLNTADISRRDSLHSKDSDLSYYRSAYNNNHFDRHQPISTNESSQVTPPQRATSVSRAEPAYATPPTKQADGYGAQKNYGYASLYSEALKDSKPVVAARPEYSFVHPWTERPVTPRTLAPSMTVNAQPRRNVIPSPTRSRSTSPSAQSHGQGTPNVVCERCCSRHHHLPLDSSREVETINSPLRRLWSEGSLRVADRSTSPRSVSPSNSEAQKAMPAKFSRQPSYLSPTVSSLAKCSPEGLTHQVALEPNPNPMPKDMLAADEPDHTKDDDVLPIHNSRSPSQQQQQFSIPSSRASSRRVSLASEAITPGPHHASTPGRSRSPSILNSTPHRLGLPEVQPRRQVVFVRDNVW